MKKQVPSSTSSQNLNLGVKKNVSNQSLGAKSILMAIQGIKPVANTKPVGQHPVIGSPLNVGGKTIQTGANIQKPTVAHSNGILGQKMSTGAIHSQAGTGAVKQNMAVHGLNSVAVQNKNQAQVPQQMNMGELKQKNDGTINDPYKNEDLFQWRAISQEQQTAKQTQNCSLLKSFGEQFKNKFTSQFNQKEDDNKLIIHWNTLFKSVQSEENGFFNFGKFENEFELVLHNIDKNKKYSDPAFTTDLNVLNGKQGQFSFRRASEIYTEFDLFDCESQIFPDNILQGQLGDCYLMSSISALAEFPSLCSRLFLQTEKNQNGLYGLWLCESGQWRQIIVDDFLVCSPQGGMPIFAKSQGKAIWVQLLEKAYAKCYGGYGRIEVGFSSDSLRDLSGSPCEYVDIKKDFKSSFQSVKESLKKNFILTASSKVGAEDLQSRHSYMILDAKEVNDSKGRVCRLLKIKNPLGYNLQMSQQWDQSVLSQLGEEVRQPHGVLWMEEKDILANFEVLTLCHLHRDFVNGSLPVPSEEKRNQLCYIQNIIDDNHSYFALTQKHEKYFKQQNPNFVYKTARIILARIDSAQKKIVSVIGGAFGNKQQAFFEVQSLPKGEYLLFLEIDSNLPKQANEYTIQTYSRHPLSLQPAQTVLDFKIAPSNLLNLLMMTYIHQINTLPEWNTKVYDNVKGEGKLIRDFSELFGYTFISYRNESNDIFTETVEVVDSDNVELKNFNRTENQSKKTIKLQPGQSDVIIYRILEKNACSHSLKFKSTWFFGTGIVKVPVGSHNSNANTKSSPQVKEIQSKNMPGLSKSVKNMADLYSNL